MQTFYLTHLYPEKMSLYGDFGNIITLKHRLSLVGWQVVYQPVEMHENLPEQTDFYFLGGGQDKEQLMIFEDLLTKKIRLQDDLDKGIAMLAICGGYQLLGESFLTSEGELIQGLGILPVKTVAPTTRERCVGNIVLKCLIPELENLQLIGFENHSGRTHFVENSNLSPVDVEITEQNSKLEQNYDQNYEQNSSNSTKKLQHKNQKVGQIKPLGQVIVGFGDNTDKIHEGCVWKNVVGSYLHGPILAKNPRLANWLLKRALITKQNNSKTQFPIPNFDQIDDSIADLMRQNILKQVAINS